MKPFPTDCGICGTERKPVTELTGETYCQRCGEPHWFGEQCRRDDGKPLMEWYFRKAKR